MAQMITLEAAVARVLEHAGAALDAERVPLPEALGRTLACDFEADEPWPPTDRSAMDGFALAAGAAGADAGVTFPVVGEALAGHPFEGVLEPGAAVRIMTGAVVPAGADAVAKVEDTSGFAGDTVTVTAAVAHGANIRPAGSEIAVGDRLLSRGVVIRAAEVGALAVLGEVAVPVVRRPTVAILSTGDEVVDVAATPAPHQVRDSNSWSLAAQVAEAGGTPVRLGVVGDDADALRAALERGLAHDVLLTIGGVSKGTHDLVHGALKALGVAEVFHGVALKPGKPAFFGVLGGPSPRHVFGLPGNPASTFTTFDLLVAPLLRARLGAPQPAPLEASIGGGPFRRNRRAQAVPVRLEVGADGRLVAVLGATRPSGDPFGVTAGDGYAVLPPGAEPGTVERAPVTLYTAGWPGPGA